MDKKYIPLNNVLIKCIIIVVIILILRRGLRYIVCIQ